jgi:cyanophycinase
MMRLQGIAVATCLVFRLSAQTTEYGPAKGALVIQGGGPAEGTGIYETFINLAGGPAAKIIIIPTAGGDRDKDGKLIAYEEEKVVAPWRNLGLTNVHMLHTADSKVADTEAFAGTLRDAKGVWFNGGGQWNCVDSYANTLTLRDFRVDL